jgi:hypothetical protein
MDKISNAARHATMLVQRYGYSWDAAIQASSDELGVSTEEIRSQLERELAESERTQLADIQKAANRARDLAIYEHYPWSLAILIAADEYDIAPGDINAEFAARRKERKRQKEQKKAAQWWIQ